MPSSISRSRDSVLDRRARIVELTKQGRPAWQVAFELGVRTRTVQRQLRAHRHGRPACRQTSAAVRERRERVAELRDRGMQLREIAQKLGISYRTVSRDLYEYPHRDTQKES